MTKNLKILDKEFLSEVFSELPSKCLLNKGVTGCGGTYCELHSSRNSIILAPTIELVKNKMEDSFFGLYGKVSNRSLLAYCQSNIPYKKIIATYDALPRILEIVPDYQKYFLLVDEYHVLFNQYTFRNESIVNILKHFREFENYCFMSATPLDENIILSELSDLDIINLEWENAVKVNIDVKDVYFTTKELLKTIVPDDNCNYHIFLNSVKTIKDIVSYLDDDYKIVCSIGAKNGYPNLNYGTTLDKPKKYNFYTSCCFEGTDIYDPIGKTVILCDTNIATTILDISTIVRQICGRLRDSIYKNQITMILNTGKHRYASKSPQQFEEDVAQNIKDGKTVEQQFIDAEDKRLELRKYSPEAYNSFYVCLYDNKLYYDDNLRKMDEYNYKLVHEIYKSSLTVLHNVKTCNMNASVSKVEQGLPWIRECIKKHEYTYQELEEMFTPIFEEHQMVWNKHKSIPLYFPNHEKLRRTINGKKQTVFRFV